MHKRLSNLRGKNILVAGGTGLIGANLTKRLKEDRLDVLSTYHHKKPSFFPEVYKRFDFTEFPDCLKATKDMDYVFICAGWTSGMKMMQDNPTISILPNLKINAGLLEACFRNRVKKVILISSSTVYHATRSPISEDEFDLNKQPYSLYFGVGWMNRYIEQLARFYFKVYGMQIGIVRASYIYGPYDNFEDKKSHVVPALIKRALEKENPFIVWGDGSTVRDFLYIEDFAADLLDVLKKYCIAEPINIGSGKGMTIREIVRIILEVCGHKVIPIYDKSKPQSIPYRVLDITKFNSKFGKRERTPFREGVRNTVEWYKLSSTP